MYEKTHAITKFLCQVYVENEIEDDYLLFSYAVQLEPFQWGAPVFLHV